MELLDPTLIDLENAGKAFGNLDHHYVREVCPQFRDELKNIGYIPWIPDIDNYENYTLKNVQDDLKHIHTLLDGSAAKPHFKKKVEFLVQLSQTMLKGLQKLQKERKEAKKVLAPKKSNLGHLKEQIGASHGDKALQLPVIQPATKEVEEKKVKKNVVKVPSKPSPKKAKETAKSNENIKKKVLHLETKGLQKISEEVADEDVSDEDSLEKPAKVDELEDMNWNLTPSQQRMVQNTLQKYGMSEEVWENYILTKVHGDAQFRRMGVKMQKEKVDCSIETLKFVEELE